MELRSEIPALGTIGDDKLTQILRAVVFLLKCGFIHYVVA